MLLEEGFDAPDALILQLSTLAGPSSADFERAEEYLDGDRGQKGVFRGRSRAVDGREVVLK